MRGARYLKLLLLAAALPLALASGRSLHQADSPTAAPDDGLQLAAAITSFGDALFDEVSALTPPAADGGSESVVLSPFSVAQALAMLLNGAEEGSLSYEQLSAWLGPQLPLDQLNEQFRLLTEQATEADDEAGLRISNANSAWLKDSYTWQDAYEAALSTYYNASLETLTTAAAVNSWVSDATRGKITEIASEEAVQQAVLLLVNAVYFKGQWMSPFAEGQTKPEKFQLAGGEMQTQMMQQRFDQGRAQFLTLSTTVRDAKLECRTIKLPYNGPYSAVVSMPAGNWSLAPTASGAGGGGGRLLYPSDGAAPLQYSEALAACRRAVSEQLLEAAGQPWAPSEAPINLYMPRFEVEFSASLVDALKMLNISAPFSPGDLTLMAAQNGAPALDLAVSEVLHKTYEKVDEKGTEAAAVDEKGTEAAAVTMVAVGVSIPIETNPPVDLRFDRPFVFNIVHEPTGMALFNGEIWKPEEAKQA